MSEEDETYFHHMMSQGEKREEKIHPLHVPTESEKDTEMTTKQMKAAMRQH